MSLRRAARERLRRRIGLRREVLILVPVALFLLVLLSIFTLFTYRDGIALLLEERRGEALLLAHRVAGLASEDLSGDDLRRLAPTARAVALVGADGTVLARSGSLPGGPGGSPGRAGVLAPLPEAVDDPGAAETFGPDRLVGDRVAAVVPVALDGGTGWVRVDLGAPGLALQRRGLGVLTWVVLVVDGGVLVLVVLFLGRVLGPYQTLLDQARKAGEVPPASEDEAAFLVATFERALEALSQPEPRPEARPDTDDGDGDDIALLQRTLAASFESGVLLLDRRGRVLVVNRPGAGLLEVEPVDLPPEDAAAGRPPEEVLAGHGELVRVLAEAVEEEKGVRRREIETTTRSGRELVLGLTVHPLRREGGREKVRGFLVLFIDLTEIRRRSDQTRLAESLQQIGELAAGVAHELRNGLATLKGYLTLIDRGRRSGPGGGGGAHSGAPGQEPPGGPERPAAAVDDDLAEAVTEMRRETDHLQRVLEDFLSFARPGTTRLEPVDLYQVLARAAADPVLADARIRLGSPPPGGLPASGDRQLLERAFRNLLHNAVQASADPGAAGGSGEGGPAAVEVDAALLDGGALEITIADRGPGVPAELKERLFQPFASARPGGVGLGLALARRIVLLHGGRLELEDRPGGGAMARVRFPAPGPGGRGAPGNALATAGD
ncbi:MAG: two-component system sensor histidine kinase NtrB [Thermoanaerobaculia bacterium]